MPGNGTGMTAVLVTGAGGFLGGAVVTDLRESGHHVRALVRRSAASSFPSGVDVLVGDIRDPQIAKQAATGCWAIVHLAGQAHALDDESVPDEVYQAVNVDGTKHLLDGAVAGGVQKFIFASSVKVFGETTINCVDERALPDPRSPYARSKWMAEQMVASYAGESGLATLSLRLPLVYGPTQKGNLYRMIEAIDRGRFPPLPRVETVRSLLHVKNFLLAVRAVLQSSHFPEPMYVATDARPYSVTALYDLLRSGLGLPPPRWRVPVWVLSLGGRCGDIAQALLSRPVPLTSSTLEKLLGQAWYNPVALIRDLGYQPRETFETAVPELIRHYRQSFIACGS
ncbi:MAG: NAD-dependent epimerase/dehydratase family protein [Nitrospira sp. CR1.3]|nr:NAD-dependent epimerase/dehydratase family protein [Nitrospira sp. CR1.3]